MFYTPQIKTLAIKMSRNSCFLFFLYLFSFIEFLLYLSSKDLTYVTLYINIQKSIQ